MTQTTQGQKLANTYPKTYATLSATFYQGVDFTATVGGKFNVAGHFLWALTQMQKIADTLHSHKSYTPAEIDRAASSELAYHYSRGLRPQNPGAFLTKCLINVVSERPEKLDTARKVLHRSVSNTTVVPSAAPTPPKRSGQTTLAGVLQPMQHFRTGGM